MIPSFTLGKTTIRQVSNKELKYMLDHAIKDWHFERSGHGFKPVSGKYDPDNPKHIDIRKLRKVHHP
jgi:hypothetical protein